MRSIILYLAALSVPLAAANYTLHFPDPNATHVSKLLTSDRTGNLFVVSTVAKTSAITNIHVTKTDPAGRLLASFEFGSSGVDTPNAAATDAQGNLIVVGGTISTASDFPLVSASTSVGNSFAIKIDAALQRIIFSTRLGAIGATGAAAVAVDPSGNIYLTGLTATGFTTTAGALQTTAPVPANAAAISHGYVEELSPAGSLIYATYFSGAGFNCPANGCTIFQPPFGGPALPVITTAPSAIAADSTGAVIVAGTTNASDIPTSSGAYSTQCGCDGFHKVAFIAKIAPGGSKLQWGTYIPLTTPSTLSVTSVAGLQQDTIAAIALDAAGNIVFTGNSLDKFPVSASAPQPAFPTAQNFIYAGYLARLDPAGSKLLSATWLGGQSQTMSSPQPGPASLALDDTGTIWVTGNAPPATLPAFPNVPALGESYIVSLSTDTASFTSFLTAPLGDAGLAIRASGGVVSALGSANGLLISGAKSGPSLLGVAGSISSSAATVVVPRQLLSLYGVNIGPVAGQSWGGQGSTIPRMLAGVQVLFDNAPAAILYAGPTQINVIVPSAVAGRETTAISIVTPDGIIPGPTIPVQATLPQVLTGSNGFALALNQDGSLNSASHAAAPNSIVTIFLTGGGARAETPDNLISTALRGNPFPVSILGSNGLIPFSVPTSLEITYAGDAPGQPAGIIQVNFRLPPWLGGIFQIQIGTVSSTFLIYR